MMYKKIQFIKESIGSQLIGCY